MAIGSDSAIHFFGTATSLEPTSGQSTVANNAFSAAGVADLDAFTNSDDAPEATFALEWQYSAGSLDAAPYVNLYAQLIAPGGLADEDPPDADFRRHFIGQWQFDTGAASSADMTDTIVGILPNTKTSQVYRFFIENQTGVTMSAGWDVVVTPRTIGPHA